MKENLALADLIIKGTVEKKLVTFKQDTGVDTHVGSLEFDVTTFKINVEKVLEGELDAESITLYQHGSADISTDAVNHIKENEEVYSILTERPAGKGYWSYNFDDGVWKTVVVNIVVVFGCLTFFKTLFQSIVNPRFNRSYRAALGGLLI